MRKYGILKRMIELIGYIKRQENLIKTIIEGYVKGKRGRGSQRLEYKKQIIGCVCCNSYVEMKRKARRRLVWRTAGYKQSADC